MMRKCHIHSHGAHLIVVVFNVAVIQGHCILILLEQNNCNMEEGLMLHIVLKSQVCFITIVC